MMYDFRDINATTKDEQLRAWSVEQALDSVSGVQHAFSTKNLVERAAAIEAFVKDGDPDAEVR